MTGKAKRKCIACGRGIATHRGKRRVCSDLCRDEAKRWRKAAAQGRKG